MAQPERTGAYHKVCSGFVCCPVSWCRGSFRSGADGVLVGVPAPGRGRADGVERTGRSAVLRLRPESVRPTEEFPPEILQIRKIVLT